MASASLHAKHTQNPPQKIMKKENKVLLKVLVEKEQKKFIEKQAKENHISEAEVARIIFSAYIRNLTK